MSPQPQGPSKPRKPSRSSESSKSPRPSLVTLASATRAMKKLTPSSQTLQKFLSSATLIHPEMYNGSSSAKLVEISQQVSMQLLLGEVPENPSPTNSEPPIHYIETDDDDNSHFRSTISSQRHLTYPQSGKIQHQTQSSLELQRIDSSIVASDSSRTAINDLIQTFTDKSVFIDGSQTVHRHDIAPMIELHMLAWREDRFIRRLQCSQIARAEIQTMKTMLEDLTTSALDNIIVARMSKSENPAHIVGWLSCSIIRHQRNNRPAEAVNPTRVLDWNIATAVNLNKGYNSGSKTYLFGDPESLRERNDLIEVVCKGIRWSQKTEFQDQVRARLTFNLNISTLGNKSRT